MDELTETLKVQINWPNPIRIQLLGAGAPAKTAFLIIKDKGVPMSAAAFTVDSVNRTGTVGFLDDKGDTTSPPTSAGAAISGVGSDAPSVLTATTDPSNPFGVLFMVVGEGTATITVNLANCLDDAGTEIPDPAPVAITVGPGDAASAELTVN